VICLPPAEFKSAAADSAVGVLAITTGLQAVEHLAEQVVECVFYEK